MGNVARRGIIDGRKVALTEVEDVPEIAVPIDSFTRECLSRYGFLQVAEKILQHERLTILEITDLLREASLPLLMKLVELKCGELLYREPVPVVVLPLPQWIKDSDELTAYERSVEFLRDIEYPQLGVVVEDIDYSRLDSDFIDLVKDIVKSRPGLTLVGPRPESILGWLSEGASPGKKSVQFGDLVELTTSLKKAGFKRLRPTSRLELVELMHGIGFPTGLTTYIDRFATAEELAYELFHIDEVSRNKGIIDLWIPGLSSRSTELHLLGTQDYKILRALAVGTLILEGITWRRAISRYLSFDAIRIARLFGANEFGVSAVDGFTANSFRLLLSKRFEGLQF